MSLTEKLTNIADAIREKTGGTEKLSLDEMAEAIAGISTGGGNEQSVLDSLIDKSITEVRSNATSVGDYCFYQCQKLENANFPAVTIVGYSAFRYCKRLTTANFPQLTQISTYGFANCEKLATINTSLVSFLGQEAFSGCKALTEVSFPAVTQISVTNIFSDCTSLKKAEFGAIDQLYSNMFNRCTALDTLIIRNENLCALTHSNALSNTPFASGGTGGTVYVPAALIEQYQQASNWSALYEGGTCNFVAIEGSEYE